MSRKVVFKTYDQYQLSLLPPSYDDLVPENHPVRIVNTIIDNVDISPLEQSYKGRRHIKLSSTYVAQSYNLCLFT